MPPQMVNSGGPAEDSRCFRCNFVGSRTSCAPLDGEKGLALASSRISSESFPEAFSLCMKESALASFLLQADPAWLPV